MASTIGTSLSTRIFLPRTKFSWPRNVREIIGTAMRHALDRNPGTWLWKPQYPDWLRALTPLHINAPADYWPQKVLAVSSANAAMQNSVSIYEHQTKPNPALPAVQGQAALLLGQMFITP